MINWFTTVVICGLVGFVAGAFASHFPGSSSDWAAWVQGVGSLLGLGVAVGIAFWQLSASIKLARDSDAQKRNDAHEAQVRVLETSRDIISRMGLVVATILDSLKPDARRANYNLRADVQTIVTYGDVLKSVPMFEIKNADALGEIVGALREVDRFRIMVEKNSFNDSIGEPTVFEKRCDRLDELIDEIKSNGPSDGVHH